jgi:3-oxoacyl-[acyl-carrier-protein] synthase-3
LAASHILAVGGDVCSIVTKIQGKAMKTGIETIVSYFPETKVTDKDYAHLKPFMPEGMVIPREKRRFADPHANEIMVVKVAEKALKSVNLAPKDIDLIVCQFFGGRFIVPGLAGFLHKQLGFRRETPAWNIQDICASFLDACEVASNAIKAGGEYKRVLVVAVSALETGGWGGDPSHLTGAVMGDGAGAAIIAADHLRGEFLAYNSETYGEIYEPAVMAFEPPAHPELLKGNKWLINKGGCGPHLTPEFDDLFTGVLSKMVTDALTNATRKAGIQISDIDIVVAHQAFAGLLEVWKQAAEPLGLPRDRWRDTWDRYGNVGACDIPATFADLIEEKAIPKGAILALFSPGGGGHTPTIIMRWNA